MRNDFHSNYLMHHGILGQKWGVRRFQNPDGSLTPAGRDRYGVKEGESVGDISSAKGYNKRIKDLNKAIKINKKKRGKEHTKIANNPENFLGMNKKHANKIAEYSENIKKGEEELERLFAKAESEGYNVRFGKVKEDKNKAAYDGAEEESRARDAAKKAGLDQGDNWKVYRDAQRGDKRAQEAVAKWESDKKEIQTSKEAKNINKGFGKVPDNWRRAYEPAEINNVSFSKQKVGGTNVQFRVNNNKYDRDTRSYKQSVSQDEAVKQSNKFMKEFSIEKAKETLTKEYYDKFADEYKDQGVSRQQFKSALKPYSVDIHPSDNGGIYEVHFDDGGFMGGHSLDIEGGLDDMKIRYHSMNG